MSQPSEKPLSVNAVKAAALFGVTYPTIRRWEKNGWITGQRIGKQRFYLYEELERLAKFGAPKVEKVG